MNETPQTYGDWTVIPGATRPKHMRCRCICGTEKDVRKDGLKIGRSMGCGCRRYEKTAAAQTTHGGSHSRTYQAWIGMKRRCSDTKHKEWKNYGGRGIIVCAEWLHDFEAFRRDIGERPSAKHSVDRHPNPNGHYEPGNVRWATQSEQHNNKRSNHLLTHNGQTLTWAQWGRITGLKFSTLRGRVQAGWSVADTLELPAQRRIRRALGRDGRRERHGN